MPTHLARDDDNTLAAIAAALDLLDRDDPPTSAPALPPSRRRRRISLTAGAVGLVAVALAVVVVSWRTDGDDGGGDAAQAASTTAPVVPVGAAVVDGELLGPLRGTSDLDGQATASPGQPVTAPRPRDGEATAWYWQLCPARTSPPERCQAIGGATTETWASPPTPDPVWIRVIVTVDVGGAQIRAASDTYRALPARVGGVPLTEGVTPVEAWLLDLVEPPSALTPDVATPVALWERWLQLHAAAATDPSVTPSGTGYRLTVGDITVDVSDVTFTAGAVTNATVCVDAHPCAPISTAAVPASPCGPAACPGTAVSATTGVTAVPRGTVQLGDGAAAIVYQLVGAPPTATISAGFDAVHGTADWFSIDLPAAPPAGATTSVPVTYRDGTPDVFVITY